MQVNTEADKRINTVAGAVGRVERPMSMNWTKAFRSALTGGYRRFNALQRGETRCFGVTMSQCLTLETLLEYGPQTVRQLAERLGLDDSTVTRLVDVLVRDGLLERSRADSGDRRRVYVALSERGAELATTLEACADAYCERILQRIPEKQRADVLAGMQILFEALDDLPAACAITSETGCGADAATQG